MRVVFNQTKDLILVVPETSKESSWIKNFPAFTKDGMYYSFPAKINIAHNIISRMRKSKVSLKVDKDVYDFLQTPFKLKRLPAEFKFHTNPMDYQEIALRYLYTVGSGGLLLDPGMGKSKVVLDYIKLMGFNRSIIVCPKALLFVWEDEIAIHRPELTFHIVKTTDWEQEKSGILENQVTVLNYTKAVMFRPELKQIGAEFIHLDEFLIKDPKTDRTKALTNLSYEIPYRCGGSGTLINNTVMDVYCPTRYLQPSLVGYNYKNFFDKHVVTVMANKGTDSQRAQIVGFRGLDEARSILESCSIVMTKEQWLKLPEKKFFDIQVQLSDEQRSAYYSLLSNYIADIQGNLVEIEYPIVMISKLYQISQGFIYQNPPEEDRDISLELVGEGAKPSKVKKKPRTTIFFEQSPKITALRELILGKLKDRRAIIWFNMEAEYEMISSMLNEEGQSYLVVKGGEKNTGDKVRTFNNDPAIKWLVCQAKSVNYGITVLGTSLEKLETGNYEVFPNIAPEVYTQIFYSMNFSLEVYLQQQDRIHRLGQKHTCEYYRIFANTPVEKRIQKAIEEKMSLRWEMLVDVAKELLV